MSRQALQWQWHLQGAVTLPLISRQQRGSDVLLLLSRDGLSWDRLGCLPWLVSASRAVVWVRCQPRRHHVKPFGPVGPVVAAGDLSFPFFPGPSKDLSYRRPRDRAAAGLLGCLGFPWPCVVSQDTAAGPGHTPQGRAASLDQHSSVACRGFGWRRAGCQALVQPGAGVVHADKE